MRGGKGQRGEMDGRGEGMEGGGEGRMRGRLGGKEEGERSRREGATRGTRRELSTDLCGMRCPTSPTGVLAPCVRGEVGGRGYGSAAAKSRMEGRHH